MDWVSNALYDALEALLSIFPDTPFKFLYDMTGSNVYLLLKWLNWFVPFVQMTAIMTGWLSAIVLWYVYQIVLRWFKAIE